MTISKVFLTEYRGYKKSRTELLTERSGLEQCIRDLRREHGIEVHVAHDYKNYSQWHGYGTKDSSADFYAITAIKDWYQYLAEHPEQVR